MRKDGAKDVGNRGAGIIDGQQRDLAVEQQLRGLGGQTRRRHAAPPIVPVGQTSASPPASARCTVDQSVDCARSREVEDAMTSAWPTPSSLLMRAGCVVADVADVAGSSGDEGRGR